MKEQLEGKRFGHWTVLSYAGRKSSRDVWLCKCVCGKEKIVQQRTLLNGESTSCGCIRIESKRNNLVGKRFGRLVVESLDSIRNQRTYWKCKCDCGNYCVAFGKNLTNNNTKSCGCINHGKGQIRKNIKGRRFGHLVTTSYVGVVNGKSIWRCRCDCGKSIDVQAYSLFSKNTNSCGCKQYPENDTKELSILFGKHASTINFVKKLLFGEHIYVLNDLQKAQMKDYFESSKSKSFSKGEKEVSDYIKSIYSGEVIENDRSVIAPKELDIYIPEKKFAIEYDGLYWHSEAVREEITYHRDKTFSCLDKGIRLFHIYENEWRDKKEICKSMIASALGIYERKEYARKCTVKTVKDKDIVINFFNTNHIQGAVSRYELALGLYKGEELLQVCVFGKQFFGRNGDIELYRMATKLNTQVLGGFSKLMKHCPWNTVVSYVALRMFDGRGYLAGKWKIEHIANPSFCITDGVNVYSRHLFKKEACLKKFDNVTEDMTEREMQVKNGFYRLWDSGTYKVRWTR